MLTSKEIKKSIVNLGYKASEISVRQQNGGYNETFYIKLKSPYIDINKVNKVVAKYQSYEIDERTGEILAGGNTFIFVRYEDNIFNEVIQKHLTNANELISKFNETTSVIRLNNNIITIKGNSCLLIQNTKECETKKIYSIEDLAKCIFKIKEFGTF